MYEIIGSCSLCGGAVEGFVGPWYGTHPPVAHCTKCGATEDRKSNVIPMTRQSEEDKTEDFKQYFYTKEYHKEKPSLFYFENVFKEFENFFKNFK